MVLSIWDWVKVLLWIIAKKKFYMEKYWEPWIIEKVEKMIQIDTSKGSATLSRNVYVIYTYNILKEAVTIGVL